MRQQTFDTDGKLLKDTLDGMSMQDCIDYKTERIKKHCARRIVERCGGDAPWRKNRAEERSALAGKTLTQIKEDEWLFLAYQNEQDRDRSDQLEAEIKKLPDKETIYAFNPEKEW